MQSPPQSPASPSGSASLPLFLQQRFFPMWVTLTLGTFADNTLRQALLIGIPAGLIAVPFFENADNAMPYIGALLPLGIMIFSSISGQLADKYETSMMFRRTKFVEIILMSAAALAFISGNGALAIAMLFAMGAQSAFFSPVRIGAMPRYLRADELVRGNGLCNAGLFSFILIGYAAGGALIVQENGGFAVGAVLISAALVGWCASLFTPKATANEPGLKVSVNAPAQTYAIFRYAFSARGVPQPLIGIGVFYFFSTAVTVAVPLYGRDSLYAEPLVWTALNVLFAIGAVIGAITAASLPKGKSRLGVSTTAIFAGGAMSFIVLVLTPFAAGSPEAPMTIGSMFSTAPRIGLIVSLIACSALGGLYIAPLQAAVQRRAPTPVRARIMAAGNFTNAAFAIPGSLSILFVTRNALDPAFVFVGVGVIMFAIGAVMLYRWRSLPTGLYDEELSSSKGED